MANPPVADYKVIITSPIRLDLRDSDRRIDFDLPFALVGGRAVLTFKVVSAQEAFFNIAINGTHVYGHLHHHFESPHRVQEVIDPVLKSGRNTVLFSERSDFGQIMLSDVVIWFQRLRTDVPIQGGLF